MNYLLFMYKSTQQPKRLNQMMNDTILLHQLVLLKDSLLFSYINKFNKIIKMNQKFNFNISIIYVCVKLKGYYL